MGYLENLWNALDFGSLRDMVLRLVSVFLCLTVHETCHGLAALALGDPTAKRARRLSLNPLRHIDWFGLLMMITVASRQAHGMITAKRLNTALTLATTTDTKSARRS